MNLDLFFQTASPSTLASLIADVMDLGTGATTQQFALERTAREVLVSNVGEIEADSLIAAAFHWTA